MKKIVGANDLHGIKNPRYHWLAEIINENSFHIGAEVGVDLGTTSQYILKHCSGLRVLYAVDLWKRATQIRKDRRTRRWENHPDLQIAWKTFNERINPYKYRVIILRGISWEMAKEVPDETLDFVFIDADHKYESVKKDILAWAPKVRVGGMITGHDINMEGVNKAVMEVTGGDFVSVGVDTCWYYIKKV